MPHDRESPSRPPRGGPSGPRARPGIGPETPRAAGLLFEIRTPLQKCDRAVDIGPHVEAKMAAVRAHGSQCAVMEFDEASLGLSRYRGIMHGGWPAATRAGVSAEMEH